MHSCLTWLCSTTHGSCRSATDVRTAVIKTGGKMADSGSVLFNFRRQGLVFIPANGCSEEQVGPVLAQDICFRDFCDRLQQRKSRDLHASSSAPCQAHVKSEAQRMLAIVYQIPQK